MTVIFESGYSLPSSDEPLTHARVAHARNWIQGDVAVSGTAGGYFADAANNSLTYEKWRSHDYYDFGDPIQWSAALASVSVSSLTWPHVDGTVYRLTEDVTTGVHRAQYNFSENIGTAKRSIAVVIKSVGGRRARLWFTDPSGGSYFVDVDTVSGTIPITSSATGTMHSLGGGWWLVNMTFTPTAGGTGSNFQAMSISGATASFLGDGASGFLFTKPILSRCYSIFTISPPTSETVDYCCIAAHDLGDFGATLKVQYDNGGGWFSTIISQKITDNSPIFCIFTPKTGVRFRVAIVSNTATIGCIRFGRAMQMERAMYGGITPPFLDRTTKLQANISESGEFLGRTRIRTDHGASFSWDNVTAAWVRDNWPDFQAATETDPFFIAWRPETFSDASYAQVTKPPQASNKGVRDLMSLSVTARGLSYD